MEISYSPPDRRQSRNMPKMNGLHEAGGECDIFERVGEAAARA